MGAEQPAGNTVPESEGRAQAAHVGLHYRCTQYTIFAWQRARAIAGRQMRPRGAPRTQCSRRVAGGRAAESWAGGGRRQGQARPGQHASPATSAHAGGQWAAAVRAAATATATATARRAWERPRPPADAAQGSLLIIVKEKHRRPVPCASESSCPMRPGAQRNEWVHGRASL